MNANQADAAIRNLLDYAKDWRGSQVENPDPRTLKEIDGHIADGDKLLAAIPDLIEAAEVFIAKVKRGEARSKTSYAQLKAALLKLS